MHYKIAFKFKSFSHDMQLLLCLLFADCHLLSIGGLERVIDSIRMILWEVEKFICKTQCKMYFFN